MGRLSLRIVGWLAVVPYVFVLGLVVTGPPTWSGLAYVLALGAVVIGLSTLPVPGATPRARRPRGITRAGALAVGFVALVRACTASSGERLSVETDDGPARLVDRVVDEADVAVAGTRVLTASRLLTDDAALLPSAMRGAYAEMRREEGDAPSPVLATYLGLQRPDAFDLVVVPKPADAPETDLAVVFLHGYAGNFALPCWQMARAVGPLGVTTACPSTRWVGDWWSRDGEAIVTSTVATLRARGIRRFVLAGLSNGGYGASRLMPRMRGLFVGLVLVSGAAPDAKPPGVPTLVVHGAHDTMADAGAARAYAARAGGRFVALDAGHFAMLVRAPEADRAIRAFVAARVSAPNRRAGGSSASR